MQVVWHGLTAIGARLPTFLVLVLLGGLAYVGHIHDWQIPKLSVLMGHASETDGEKSEPEQDKKNPSGLVKLESPETVQKIGLQTATVTERAMAQYVPAHGSVEFNQDRLAHLQARVPGIIWRVEKEEGDQLKQGDVLVIIDTADVGKAKAEFLQNYTQMEMRMRAAERLEKTSGAVPARQIDEAQTALRESRVRLFNAQQMLINLGLPVKLEDLAGLADDVVGRRLQFLGLPAELSKSLPPESTPASLLPITAPFESIVVARHAVIGEMVNPMTHALFTVADISRMWVFLDVSVEDSRRLALGQEVLFRPDSSEEDVHAKVLWISAEIDEKTRTVRVRVEVANPQGRLRAHQFGMGRILVASNPAAIAVPDEALQLEDRQPIVFVKVDDVTYQKREVRPGVSDGGFTEIKEGLRPGEEVVTRGSHVLKSELLKARISAGE